MVVVLVSRSLIVLVFVFCVAVKPVMEPAGLLRAVQVKSPPVTSQASVALNVDAEQMGVGCALVKWGVGLTVTVKLVMAPLQLFPKGVMW